MPKNVKVFLFDEERQTIYTERFIDVIGDDLETKDGLYPLKDSVKFINEADGTLYYFLNMPLPAKVEAENLKKLRRNAALNNIFNYHTKKPFDLMAFMPYIIIALLIMFM